MLSNLPKNFEGDITEEWHNILGGSFGYSVGMDCREQGQ